MNNCVRREITFDILRGVLAMCEVIGGSWTYRIYRDDPEIFTGDAIRTIESIFGEEVFNPMRTSGKIIGIFDLGGGYILAVAGSVEWDGTATAVALAGIGSADTPTVGWGYDYRALPAFIWPAGVGQVPALIGSVIRAKPHGGSPAGYVAAFLAVCRPGTDGSSGPISLRGAIMPTDGDPCSIDYALYAPVVAGMADLQATVAAAVEARLHLHA